MFGNGSCARVSPCDNSAINSNRSTWHWYAAMNQIWFIVKRSVTRGVSRERVSSSERYPTSNVTRLPVDRISEGNLARRSKSDK